MHNFLLDLWHDLREKRLWPFAVALAAAIAAVPFVLVKKEEPAPAPAAVSPNTAAPQAAAVPTVTLEDASTSTAVPSRLEAFKQKNPFKPIVELPKEADDDQNKTVDADASESASKDSGSSDASGKSGSGSAGAGSGSGGNGGTSSGGAGSVAGPIVSYFTYRADIRFGEPGKEKKIEQIEKFSLLGGDKDIPAAMYLGISDDAKQIALAVDTSLYEASGEGECKPDEDHCDVLYLTVGDDTNEATITSLDGTQTYNVELLKIERVTLDKDEVESVPEADDDADAGKANHELDKADVPVDSLFDVISKKTR
jgi:hypothetical protein